MAKKHAQNPIQSRARSSSSGKLLMDFNALKTKNTLHALVLFIALLILFSFALFKNISYPLFWADESMTAIGAERVIEFGFPKVHDGKNVFYDLRHTNPALGINEDDAYIGGTGWGHYYFGVIGYKIADKFDDLYLKTGVFRSSFALIGLLGLLVFAFLVSRFFRDRFSQYSFLALFFLLELFSISLLLLMREVRYYSLVLLLGSLIFSLYAVHRFYRPFHKVAYIAGASIALWLLFLTFSPVYIIFLVALGLSELFLAIRELLRKKPLKSVAAEAFPALAPLFISFAGIIPLLGYFKTFEISKAMAEFNGYGYEMYWTNISTVLKYFTSFELLWGALLFKLAIIAWHKKVVVLNRGAFQLSLLMCLFFIVFTFTIARIPNFIYTRYIIYAQPILTASLLTDLFLLVGIFSRGSRQVVNGKTFLTLLVAFTFFIVSVVKNMSYWTGYIHQLSSPYKGPLDYTIPFLKEQYPTSDTLVIAANYEETSYMYYLRSKVVVGFIGNNLEEDARARPHVIAYRKPWGNFPEIFQGYLRNAAFDRVLFPVRDNPVNNIPELNFIPNFNHQFESLPSTSEQDGTELFILKK